MRTARFELPFGRAVLVLLVAVTGAVAGDLLEVRGRVVDERGRPVAGAAVDSFWRANGTGRGPDGKTLRMDDEAQNKEFWSHLGEMEPSTPRAATTGPDGRFTVSILTGRHALMAMDRERRRGGVAILPKGKEREPIEVRVGPLVTLRGSFRGPGAGEKPAWTHVYLSLPDDLTRPLDSTRLVSCGSYDARFVMSLPPGRYVLYGYNDTTDAYLVPDRELDLAPGKADVDLGTLRLSNAVSSTSVKIDRSRSAGRWVDVAERYGKPAPRWHLTDARGIARDARIEDFRGKWLLIYFWGFGCAPCLREGLPSLAKFYEEHAADRDRFELVALCLDDDGGLTTMAAVDRKLEPIVEHIWGGKPLPFPVALDASFQTFENFGIATLGPQLVDPAGVLIKGDEAVLAEKLRGPVKTTAPRP